MRQALYDRFPDAVMTCSALALALAAAALTMQYVGESLSSAYLMVFTNDPAVTAAVHQANADIAPLSTRFIGFARAVWIIGSIAALLALGVAIFSPRRHPIRWIGILALVFALAALWAQAAYEHHLRWS